MIIELLDAEEVQREYVDEQRREATEEGIEKGLAIAAINIMLTQHCSVEEAMTSVGIEKDKQPEFRKKYELDSIEK